MVLCQNLLFYMIIGPYKWKNMIIIVPMFSQELFYDNYQTPFSHVEASKGELVIYIEMDTKQNDLHGVMVQHAWLNTTDHEFNPLIRSNQRQ